MATVYLAADLRHDRQVAIKVLHEDLGAALGAERFLTEIKTTARLQHPHILPLLDSGTAGGLLYYVMPYMTGETLRDRLSREKQLPLEDVLQLAREVADALGAAHALGIIHRDIKPHNILLQGGHAVVADSARASIMISASPRPLRRCGVAADWTSISRWRRLRRPVSASLRIGDAVAAHDGASLRAACRQRARLPLRARTSLSISSRGCSISHTPSMTRKFRWRPA